MQGSHPSNYSFQHTHFSQSDPGFRLNGGRQSVLSPQSATNASETSTSNPGQRHAPLDFSEYALLDRTEVSTSERPMNMPSYIPEPDQSMPHALASNTKFSYTPHDLPANPGNNINTLPEFDTGWHDRQQGSFAAHSFTCENMSHAEGDLQNPLPGVEYDRIIASSSTGGVDSDFFHNEQFSPAHQNSTFCDDEAGILRHML